MKNILSECLLDIEKIDEILQIQYSVNNFIVLSGDVAAIKVAKKMLHNQHYIHI